MKLGLIQHTQQNGAVRARTQTVCYHLATEDSTWLSSMQVPRTDLYQEPDLSTRLRCLLVITTMKWTQRTLQSGWRKCCCQIWMDQARLSWTTLAIIPCSPTSVWHQTHVQQAYRYLQRKNPVSNLYLCICIDLTFSSLSLLWFKYIWFLFSGVVAKSGNPI